MVICKQHVGHQKIWSTSERLSPHLQRFQYRSSRWQTAEGRADIPVEYQKMAAQKLSYPLRLSYILLAVLSP